MSIKELPPEAFRRARKRLLRRDRKAKPYPARKEDIDTGELDMPPKHGGTFTPRPPYRAFRVIEGGRSDADQGPSAPKKRG